MMSDFWPGKRVFVTGHTGFKGGWLCLWLKSMGADVTGYALEAPTKPSLFQIAQVELGMRSIIGDIRDLDNLKNAMKRASPEIVMHLAAQPLVRESYLNPVETYSTNVMGTVHLLEAVRNTPGIKAVVNVTTDKCYENREWLWGYRENESMGGYDPYSNSKGCSELVTAAYRSSFFSPGANGGLSPAIATARAGNVIGGGDWARDRLVPDMIAAFSNGRTVSIRNPDAIRPWQHVLEPLGGYLLLAQKLYENGFDFAEAWNFGPKSEDERPVRWIADVMTGLWSGARWAHDTSEHPHEAQYLKLDISKARTKLNWHPVLSLEDSLKLVVDWAIAMKNKADMNKVTLDQIQAYSSHFNSKS